MSTESPVTKGEDQTEPVLGTEAYTCYRCYNVAPPKRQYSQNAGIWYMGCARCSSGVFFNN